jgi:hypothetical protein
MRPVSAVADWATGGTGVGSNLFILGILCVCGANGAPREAPDSAEHVGTTSPSPACSPLRHSQFPGTVGRSTPVDEAPITNGESVVKKIFI